MTEHLSSADGPSSCLWQGMTICQYRLVREIGRGSVGIVYRAEDTSLQRPVAIKLFPTRIRATDRAEDYSRFINEARSSASLDHENIVRIYEIGQDDDWLFIAMELVSGMDLESMITSAGPIDARRACLIGAEVAQALAYAHQMGVIHRDIKPGNLILSRTGQCKITDFGLARRLDSSDEFTDPSRAVGTPHYIAPEVACGKPATPASDVYGLGATLWHLLAGRPVFQAPHTRGLIMKHIRERVPDLCRVRPDIDKDLVRVLERALAKRPQERWAADQLARMLWSLTIPASASTLAVPSTGHPGFVVAKPPRIRKETLTPILAAAFGLLIAVGAIYVAAISWTHPMQNERLLTGKLDQAREDQVLHAQTPAEDVATPDTILHRVQAVAPPVAGMIAASDISKLQQLIAIEDWQRYLVYGKVSVAQTTPTGKSFRISFEPNSPHDGFYAVAFPALFPALEAAFGGANGSGLEGREIAVIGRVTEYRNRPQIKLHDIQQILVLDAAGPRHLDVAKTLEVAGP